MGGREGRMGREDAIMSPLHSYFCTLLLLFHNLKQRLTLTNVSEMLRVRGIVSLLFLLKLSYFLSRAFNLASIFCWKFSICLFDCCNSWRINKKVKRE
jgi:hypothetical protein